MQIPDDLEVGYVPLSMGGAYPGLYLFTSPSRFVRPVRNISILNNKNDNIELIGPFEQVNIDFCASDNCLQLFKYYGDECFQLWISVCDRLLVIVYFFSGFYGDTMS